MPFTFDDLQDLVRLIRQHPEWQRELWKALSSSELDEIRAILRETAELQRANERVIKRLFEAYQRSEERLTRLEQAVAELAEAQRRTEQRVQELAEAQRRTEQRLEELAEAQRRTDQRVEELAQAQQRLASELGGLKTIVGATIEEEAGSVVQQILQQKGYQPLDEPYSIAVDGEADIVFPARDPSGRTIWVLVEARVRLSRRDVIGWAQRMRSYGWQQRLAQQGVVGPYLVYVYGIRVDAAARQEVMQQGIGLMYSQGELIALADLIYSTNESAG